LGTYCREEVRFLVGEACLSQRNSPSVIEVCVDGVMRVKRANSMMMGHPKSHRCAQYFETGGACSASGGEERRIRGVGGGT
jgi:hypothetical protein